jgi:putative ABC transport system permease protein
MGRLAWSQLRFRAARAVALLAGLMLAATAFTVLTAASRTSQLRTVGTVAAHFRPAFDILVRPRGSRTALEAGSGTIGPNFLSGIYGGISMAQYHRIQQIPGVQVAAPIAMVGYTLIRIFIPVLLPAADSAPPGRQLYRYATTWVSAGGTTRIAQPASYLYLTPDRLVFDSQGDTDEILPGGSSVTVCPGPGTATDPFGPAAQSNGYCWSKINGNAGTITISEPPLVGEYWTAGPVSYLRAGRGTLTPVLARNPPSLWQPRQATTALLAPPMDETDSQYRHLQDHVSSSGPLLAELVGEFDQARVRSFDPLSQVPLGPYQPITAAPADAASRKALGGGDLLPSLNLGGYVSQPAQLITTLAALPGLAFGRNPHASDPLSVIRVRVAGITGPNALSLERIREVAQQIAVSTGLDVDIVTGSSPTPTAISLPAGRFGQPRLELTEGWAKKGIAVAILTAVDKKSAVLFTLILVVCVLFVANSAAAAVQGRRRELGVLACLGWTRSRLFAAVLGEVAAIGLAAGVLGAVAALPLSAALGLRASPGRAALAVPVAVVVAIVSGTLPAWLAARADPLAAVRPPVLAVRRGRQLGGITALAIVNAARAPGRALVGVISLAVGVAGLTLLTAVTGAFRGVVVGSLLGDAVAVQVRGVDYVAVAATVALGALAVADVVFLNIRERAAELATIRTFGWRESALARLVVTEGAVIGIAGSLVGGALGLAGAAEFAGQLPARLLVTAAAAVAAGVLVTAAAALLPAQMLRGLPAANLLAEE